MADPTISSINPKTSEVSVDKEGHFYTETEVFDMTCKVASNGSSTAMTNGFDIDNFLKDYINKKVRIVIYEVKET